MSDEPEVPGRETLAEEPALEDGQPPLDEVQTENPLPLTADVYAAQYWAEYESPFGLHQPAEWRHQYSGTAGYHTSPASTYVPPVSSGGMQFSDGYRIEGEARTYVDGQWYGTTPATGDLPYGAESEAGYQYMPRSAPIPGVDDPADRQTEDLAQMPPIGRDGREAGEGPWQFQGEEWNQDNWQDSLEDGDLADFQESAPRPMRFHELGVRDIEVMWRWVGGMSDELVLARYHGWRRIERLLEAASDTLRRRGEALMQRWNSAADGVSASEAFLERVDASIVSMDHWAWIADRHASALWNVKEAIRIAQLKLRPLYIHYRVALALQENWRAIQQSGQDPTYGSAADQGDLPPLGTLAGQPRDGNIDNLIELVAPVDIVHDLRINDPSDGWSPHVTPVLYDGSGGYRDVSSPEEVLEAYHNRAAEIVQPLADIYENEHRFSLTRGRRFEGPNPQDVGPPRDLSGIEMRPFAMPGIPGVTGGGGPAGLGLPAGLTAPGALASAGPPPPIAPNLPAFAGLPGQPPPVGLPPGGFLAGTPVAPGVTLPPGAVAPGVTAPIGPGTVPPIPPIPITVPGAVPGVAPGVVPGATALPGQVSVPGAAAVPGGVTAPGAVAVPGTAGAGIPGFSPVAGGAPVTLPGLSAAGISAAGAAAAALQTSTGLGAAPPVVGPDGLAVPGATPATAAGAGFTGPGVPGSGVPGTGIGAAGAAAAPGAVPGQPGSGMLMPPPPPPLMPPMAGQQSGQPAGRGGPGSPHLRGAAGGVPPVPPPAFIPPGRVSQPGRTPTAPQRVPATLPGATGRTARTGGLTGLRGTNPAARPAAAPRPAPPASPAEAVPAPGDQELWTVKKPKRLLQGAPPGPVAEHSRPIGSPG